MRLTVPHIPLVLEHYYERFRFSSSGSSSNIHDPMKIIWIMFIPLPSYFIAQVSNILKPQTATIRIDFQSVVVQPNVNKSYMFYTYDKILAYDHYIINICLRTLYNTKELIHFRIEYVPIIAHCHQDVIVLGLNFFYHNVHHIFNLGRKCMV